MLAIIEACPKALCVIFKKEVAEIILVKQMAEAAPANSMDKERCEILFKNYKQDD